VLAATLVAAALRFFRLGHQCLWIDEVMTWYNADFGSPFRLPSLLENVHGPLYGLIVRVWCGAVGDSEWALRLPSALPGVLVVPALAWLARVWLGRDAVIPAAWLAAGSPFLVWYSQEARSYSLLVLCVVLASAALLALARRPAPRAALAYAASAGAGLLSSFSFALVVPLHLRWWLAGPVGRGRRLALLGAALLAMVLVVLPWAPRALHTLDWQRLRPGSHAGAAAVPLRGGTTFHAGAIPFALHAFAVGYTLGPSLRELRGDASLHTLARHAPEIAAVALVFGLLLVAGFAELARRGRLVDAAIWLLAPALVVSYFAFQNFKVFHPRYLFVSYPGFLLVLAAAFPSRGPKLRVTAGVAIGGLWIASLGHHYFDPRYGKEDYRGAAALIREHGAPGEMLLAVNSEEPMDYYYRGPLPQGRLWLGFAGRPELPSKLDQALGGARGAWVVLSRHEDLDPKDQFAHAIDSRYPDAGRWMLEGVRVWHIRRS
jgi:4-amino-4-deoxy-L-arabinose transferase-like glycosyltransferase